ncbi:MAG: siderophore-interacting protein [Mycetocola sp.]
MLTTTEARPRTIPNFRPYAVSVAGVQRLSPTFVRVTFTGAELSHFGTHGLDQRIKIVLPLPGVGITPLDETDWFGGWRALPDELRNPIRTYTVRAVRPGRSEVDVDFVLHGDGGPASRWVQDAHIGDELCIVGPDSRGLDPSVGIEWKPGAAKRILLAGDETATPAICSILASLPRSARGCAFLEVPHEADAVATGAPDGVQVTWLARGDQPHGSALEPAVRAWTASYITDAHHGADVSDVDIDHEILWEVPEPSTRGSELYAWLAGEASVIKTLRRFLVSETGLDRHQVAFMGYWRTGRAEN